VGDVAIFVAAVNGVQAGLSAAISSVARAHESTLTFDHVRYVVRTAAEPPSPTQPHRPAATSRLAPLRHGIELRDVWFRYRDGLPWVLQGVDLFLPAGRSTALVGINGAGKSTLVKLLCGLYEPTRGSIHWDGSDLRELPVDEVRRRIGAVFQDFMEYELTAAESIGLGDLTRWGDRHQIEAAARRAGCHDMVAALPSGYDTMLTRIYTDLADRNDPGTGVVLSGGQSQRIALARALLRQDCDLLILDEPSAGLDAAAEYEVHRRLRDHSRDKTSLLISHRLSAVRDADTIVVLREGTVVEQGAHDQLLAAGGPYAELFTLQAAGYRTEPSDLTGVV
jgi:ATP-binding cassette subfamily B protein